VCVCFQRRIGPAAAWIAACAFLVALLPATCLAGKHVPDPASFLRPAGVQFISPLPGSRFHPAGTSIVIRPGDPLAPGPALEVRRWSVAGDRSGVHEGSLVLSRDARTLIFRPAIPFSPGEQVHVQVGRGLTTQSGVPVPSLDWSFEIRAGEDGALRSLALQAARWSEVESASNTGTDVIQHLPADLPVPPAAPVVPKNYLPVSVYSSNDPDTVGGIFMTPFRAVNSDPGRLLILDHRAQPLFFRTTADFTFDFRRQPNGRLTYWDEGGMYLAMDSTYTVVDTFRCGNGYVADEHDLQLLPNGHALLLAYDPEPYPMDTVVVGGRHDAIVIGLIVQELDEAKNVVFQWRSWDHFRVTDAIECAVNFTGPAIDYVHGNAIEEDFDGNLLLSSRHFSEISKIDRATGDVRWRLGPHAKENQFTFYDDQTGFSLQHDIRRLANGDLCLFDNGNCVSPHSRTVEYAVDETNLTAQLILEYVHTPPVNGPFMGNHQQHEDGSVTIGWGGSSTDPKVTELHPDGTVALDLAFGTGNRYTYRALRFPWETTAFTTVESVGFGSVLVGSEATQTITVTNHLATALTLNQFVTTDTAFAVVSPDSLSLAPGESASLLVRFRPVHLFGTHGDLYVRAVNDTELVARVVHLSGIGSGSGVTIGDVALPEGALGDTTAFTFAVKVTPPASDTVTVHFATADSSAFAWLGQYVPTSGTLVFPPGDTLASVVVPVIGDDHAQFSRVFQVELSQLKGATFVRDVAYGTILNDDGSVGVGPDGSIAVLALRPPVPNPVRESAAIEFDLPRRGAVSLEVFDVRGRRVADLVEGVQPAGRRSLTWRTNGRSAGVYFVRLRAEGLTRTQRLVVMR